MITKFGFLTDEEILQLCHTKRQQSPLIEELCQRLEFYLEEENDSDDAPSPEDNLFCPVCESKLRLEIETTTEDSVVIVEPKLHLSN